MAQELKAETIVPQGSVVSLQMYPKADVDAVLAELEAKNGEMESELAALKEAQRWRKCSEELPTENDANESGKAARLSWRV